MTICIAHRGASGYEPENTIRAFERAIDMNADYLELDVRLSKDGVPAVIHDDSIDRTTDGSGAVAEFTMQELQGFDAGAGEGIPPLADVLESAAGRAGVLIELKELQVVEPVIALLRSIGDNHKLILQSFNTECLELCLAELPDIPRGLLFDKLPDDLYNSASLTGVSYLNPSMNTAAPDVLAGFRASGFQSFVWTVNAPDDISRMVQAGADGIITNFPDRLT